MDFLHMPLFKHIIPHIPASAVKKYVEHLPLKTKKDIDATMRSIERHGVKEEGAKTIETQVISSLFPHSSTVTEGKQMEEVYVACQEYLKYSQLYADKYPGYLFLIERDVNEILEKYDLYEAKSDNYIGQIPPENQQEIIAFTKLVDENDFVKRSYGSEDANYTIIAPQKDFSSILKRDGKSRKLIKLPVVDPIVLANLHGGHLVVSKWGDEADIPEVNVLDDRKEKPKKKPFFQIIKNDN
ncbi:hypothetical protein ACFL4H_00310 [Candidatus Neomarinimicrobiota bacterium]